MKFYKLTEEDLPTVFSMSESELKVYCWLSVNLPFDDSKPIEIDTANLAEQIGISRRSVQRAVLSLSERKIFDIEITKAKVKRITANSTNTPPWQHDDTDVAPTTQMSSDDTDVVSTTQMSLQRHRCRRNDTDVATTTQMSPTKLKTKSRQEFQISQTIQTYKDCINSLSEDMRENFLKFCQSKAMQLPKPPTLIESWIRAHFTELLKAWQNSTGRSSKNFPGESARIDWEQAPNFSEMLIAAWQGRFNEIPKEFINWFYEVKEELDLYGKYKKLVEAST